MVGTSIVMEISNNRACYLVLDWNYFFAISMLFSILLVSLVLVFG